MKPKISVLISTRKNSKYLAKFLFGFYRRTGDLENTEVLVMLNAGDTWNMDLAHYFTEQHGTKFYTEDLQLGRAGLHVYFNELLQQATGDWIIYFCEDHFITMDGWDSYIREMISGHRREGDSLNKLFPLDPSEPWILVPKFDNCGSMNHIVSRGFVDLMGGVIGRHGWIDSYLNDLIQKAWGDTPMRVIRVDVDMFHDFTHDQPNPMSDAHLQGIIGPEAEKLPKHDSPEYWQLIRDDVEKLKGGNQ